MYERHNITLLKPGPPSAVADIATPKTPAHCHHTHMDEHIPTISAIHIRSQPSTLPHNNNTNSNKNADADT